MRARPDLSVEQAERRYEEERRQGEAIAGGLEDAWGWTGPSGRRRAERRAARLIEAARLGPGVRCLELGCGTGEFTSRLVESGCELVALELSETTAAVCRERVGGHAEVVVGNAETGEGLDGREFDAIVGVSVLHHLNLDLALANSFRLLRSGGQFAFSEPNMANPQIWAERNIPIVRAPSAHDPARDRVPRRRAPERFRGGRAGRRAVRAVRLPAPGDSAAARRRRRSERNIPIVRRLRHTTPHETAFRAGGLRNAFEAAGLAVELCEPFDFQHPAIPRPLVGAVDRAGRMLESTPLCRFAGSIWIQGWQP